MTGAPIISPEDWLAAQLRLPLPGVSGAAVDVPAVHPAPTAKPRRSDR